MEDETQKVSKLWISGIVAVHDQKPYIQFSTEKGMMAQLSISAAQQVAMYILRIAASMQADTVFLKFFSKSELTKGFEANLMKEFRDFRAEQNGEVVKHQEQ